MNQTLTERFYAKVDKNGTMPAQHPELGQCHIWTANRHKAGYGRFMVARRVRKASRVAWEIECGPIPDGLYVLHKCDNPPCVRTSHLYLGTQFDNMRDALERGHLADTSGERNGRAKLSRQQVEEIRSLNQRGGASLQVLADAYRVNKRTIAAVLNGRNWH